MNDSDSELYVTQCKLYEPDGKYRILTPDGGVICASSYSDANRICAIINSMLTPVTKGSRNDEYRTGHE